MTKIIYLGGYNRNIFAKVDDEDYEELNQFSWNMSGGYARRATSKKKGELKKTTVSMHRHLLRPPKDKMVDHINGDKLDNRKINLRLCTRLGNAQNRGMCRTNTSGYKGVWKNGRRWSVYIYRNGKNVFGGSFIDKKDAARAYNKLATEFHGKFAHLNKC